MDSAQLVPFGRLERFQVPRRLGKKEPHIRSTLITRLETLSPLLDQILENVPPLIKIKLYECIKQRDVQILVSRNEFEQLNSVLQKVAEKWPGVLDNIKNDVLNLVKTWYKSSGRGLFRFLVLLLVFIIETRSMKAGQKLFSKGLGGLIKNELMKISSGIIDAKPGSLYNALEKFEDDKIIDHYKNEAVPNPVSITVKGRALIISALRHIKETIALLDNSNFLSILKQENIDAAGLFLQAVVDQGNVKVELNNLVKSIINLDSDIKNLQAIPSFSEIKDQDVKKLIAEWKDDLNRTIIDVYVLCNFFTGPAYGNHLIAEAGNSLEFQAGTLYPKIKNYLDAKLITLVTDEERLVSVKKADSKTQGPPKIYYEISARGALFFVLVLSLFLAEMDVLFKMVRELVDLLIPPLKPEKQGK